MTDSLQYAAAMDCHIAFRIHQDLQEAYEVNRNPWLEEYQARVDKMPTKVINSDDCLRTFRYGWYKSITEDRARWRKLASKSLRQARKLKAKRLGNLLSPCYEPMTVDDTTTKVDDLQLLLECELVFCYLGDKYSEGWWEYQGWDDELRSMPESDIDYYNMRAEAAWYDLKPWELGFTPRCLQQWTCKVVGYVEL